MPTKQPPPTDPPPPPKQSSRGKKPPAGVFATPAPAPPPPPPAPAPAAAAAPAPTAGRTRKRGGAGAHLSEAARAALFAAIIQGHDNRRINLMLVNAGHLPPGSALTRATIAEYRRDENARIQLDRLTIEAIQVGHMAVSEVIINAVRAHRACVAELFSDEEEDRLKDGLETGKIAVLTNMMNKSAATIWEHMGSTDFLQIALRDYEGQLAAIENATTLTDLQRKELIVEVKESLYSIMKQASERQQAAIAAGTRAPGPVGGETSLQRALRKAAEDAAAVASGAAAPPVVQ